MSSTEECIVEAENPVELAECWGEEAPAEEEAPERGILRKVLGKIPLVRRLF